MKCIESLKEVSFHKSRRKWTSLNKGQSLIEQKVMYAIAGIGGKTSLESRDLVAISRNEIWKTENWY
jgi:hypothetical protein